MSEREPGELAYEAFTLMLYREPFANLCDVDKIAWARAESAIRADDRAKVDAEIERLKAELSAIDGVAKQIVETMTEGSNAVIKPLREEIERLKAENIRLREALGEILHAVCGAARAALEEEKK